MSTRDLSPIEGSTLPVHKHHPSGPADPDEHIEVILKLRRRSQEGLPTLDEFLAGARSFMTREELAERHGADPEDIARIRRWAASKGLAVGRVDAAARSVHLVGSVAALGETFGVKLGAYRHAETGTEFRAHGGPVHLDPEISDAVMGVFGLDSYPVAVPRMQQHPSLSPAFAAEPDTSVAQLKEQWPGSFLPNEVAKLYNFPPNNGAGQKVAILEFGGGFSQATLTDYFTNIIGLDTPPTVNAHSVMGTGQDINNAATGEVYLDIEVVGAMAPGVEIDVYFAPFTGAGYLAAIERAIQNDDYAAVSISWGFSEDAAQGWAALHANVDEAFRDAVSLGIPVFVSAGDNGSGDAREKVSTQGGGVMEVTPNTRNAHANYPASSPYATACGGTQVYADNGKITHEVVWNEQVGPLQMRGGGASNFYIGGATGGGVSDRYSIPSYQSKAGLKPQSVNTGAGTGRGVPDVAGNAGASTGYLTSQPPGSQVAIAPVGGTSAVAPMWAALMACVRAALVQDLGKVPAFHFNDFVYATGASDAFKDIVGGRAFNLNQNTGQPEAGDFTPIGNNRSSVADGYYAKAGYDLCTGFGRPDGANLLQQLKNWLSSQS